MNYVDGCENPPLRKLELFFSVLIGFVGEKGHDTMKLCESVFFEEVCVCLLKISKRETLSSKDLEIVSCLEERTWVKGEPHHQDMALFAKLKM